MSRISGVLMLVFALGYGGVAQANPVSVEVVRARQVPGTLHVQLTYGYDGTSAAVPTKATRDGSAITGAWAAFSGYSANTGSGLKSIAAQQLCDCDVSVGSHAYAISVKSGSAEQTMKLSISVVSNLGQPADAGVPGPDMLPWDIPEPSQLQGLDCRTACTAPPADRGPVVNDAGPAVDKLVPAVDQMTADTSKPKPAEKDEGGCSLGGGANLSGLGLLLALAGLIAVRRRR